jgi:uncharacterized repeat protein (TIGR01451 family)
MTSPAGQALLLDGQTYVQVPAHPQLLLGKAVTIQALVLPRDYSPDTFKHIVELWGSYLLRLDNPAEGNRLSFFTFLDGNPEPRMQAGVLETGRWHQVVAVWDGSTNTLWLDGRKRASARQGAPAPLAGPLRIGQHFIGAIDEVKVYDRALSEDEIAEVFPGQAQLALQASRSVFAIGESVALTCTVSNTGGRSLTNGAVELSLPAGLALLEGQTVTNLTLLTRQAPITLNWKVRAAGALASQVKVRAGFAGAGFVETYATIVVSKLLPSGGDLLPGPAALLKSGEDLILGNGHLRVVFPKNDFGYGVFAVDASQAGQWRRMAVASSFSQLAVKPSAEVVRRLVYTTQYRPVPGGDDLAGVEFFGPVSDGAGGVWDCSFTFVLDGDDRLKVAYQATPNRDGALVSFHGPMLHVGEGAFGKEKDDGLFCGLEWLVSNEASSSNLDMHDPDHYIRFVPHPNKITLPLMAFTQGGSAIALYWECLQKWDGVHAQPSAVFASPNFVEHQENHLMGLLLPSAPVWLKPNSLEAVDTPYLIKAGAPLRLECWIACVTPAAQSVDCLSRWFATFGVPDPMPKPRGDFTREIEFSMRAHLESLWDPVEQKWWTSKGGGELLSTKTLPPAYAFQLRLAATVTANPALRQQYNDMAALAASLGRFDLLYEDVGYTWGYPPTGLLGLRNPALANLTSMWDDGSWRFRTRIETSGIFKGMDYSLLGQDKAAEVGTCARNAFEMLRFSRLTGDKEAFQMATRSLQFMKRFTVPRAAQVWECPVHSPDILAAADAVEAYLEAYACSGERQYLETAVSWAWRGLPFLYFWNPPERPLLRYASIAIYGGSWFNGSWIGQPVQWNGLRYAYALLKLAEHDSSFPWRKVAEGVTVSAMYQQDQQGPNVALWPDNFSAIDWSRCPWVFEPGLILKNVYKLMGRDVEPASASASLGGQRAVISARGTIAEVSWVPDLLSFKVHFPPGDAGYVMVAGVSRPAGVVFDGAALSEAPGKLWEAAQPAWKHEPPLGFLAIRSFSDGWHSVQVQGVAAWTGTHIPPLLNKITFRFNTDLEGWTSVNQIDSLRVENGCLKGLATGGDPYMHRSRLKLDGNQCWRVVVRTRAVAGQAIALYWLTEDSPNWAEDKVIHLPFQPGLSFRNYLFEVGKHPLWTGHTITAIRLDPLESGPGGDFEVDSIEGQAAGFVSYRFTGDDFWLQLRGGTEGVYRLEASTNLLDWVALASLSAGEPLIGFLDAKARWLARRFYRAVLYR